MVGVGFIGCAVAAVLVLFGAIGLGILGAFVVGVGITRWATTGIALLALPSLVGALVVLGIAGLRTPVGLPFFPLEVDCSTA